MRTTTRSTNRRSLTSRQARENQDIILPTTLSAQHPSLRPPPPFPFSTAQHLPPNPNPPTSTTPSLRRIRLRLPIRRRLAIRRRRLRHARLGVLRRLRRGGIRHGGIRHAALGVLDIPQLRLPAVAVLESTADEESQVKDSKDPSIRQHIHYPSGERGGTHQTTAPNPAHPASAAPTCVVSLDAAPKLVNDSQKLASDADHAQAESQKITAKK